LRLVARERHEPVNGESDVTLPYLLESLSQGLHLNDEISGRRLHKLRFLGSKPGTQLGLPVHSFLTVRRRSNGKNVVHRGNETIVPVVHQVLPGVRRYAPGLHCGPFPRLGLGRDDPHPILNVRQQPEIPWINTKNVCLLD
jgi:hypothetical protein